MDKEKQRRWSLIDIGIHILDLTLWLMDNYKPVTVLGSSYGYLGKLGRSGNGQPSLDWRGV